jgi:predicted MFS family arabinose efflux permease
VYRGPLAISFATSIASISGVILLYPVLPVLASDFAVDEARIGLTVAAFTAPGIVLAPLFGVLADMHGRRWILILGLTLFGLAGGAAALAPSYEWVLFWRLIQGVGVSALLPLTIVLISDLLPDEREIHGQGTKVALDRVATVVLPPLGGALALLSWRAAFAAFLLILGLALAAVVWMPETKPRGRDTLRQYLTRIGRAVREPRLTLAFATGFVRFFLDYGLFTYLPLLLALRYGATPVMSGTLIAISALGSITTAMCVGHIYHRMTIERLLLLAFFGSTLALAMVALIAPLWLVAVAMFLFGLGNGFISPLQKSMMTRRTAAELRGGVIAVDRLIQQIAKSAAPAMLGLLLLVAELQTLMWSLTALSAAFTVALLVIGWRRPATPGV